MGRSLADVYVDVLPNLDRVEPETKKALGKVRTQDAGKAAGDRFGGGFSKSVKRLAITAAAAFSARAIITGINSLVAGASDLNETVSKTENIFGKSSAEIKRFASTSTTSLGLSKQAALEGLSSFGNFFNQIGIGTKASVKMSKGLVQLSADLGSFNNADPAQVMAAFQSATNGEYDALQRFIPTVNAATVETEALRATHKKTAGELTVAEKATALYTIAQRDAGKAQGDFARTSDGLANIQRTVAGQVTDLKNKIGAQLLPVFIAGGKILRDRLLPALDDLADKYGPRIAAAIVRMSEKIGPFVDENLPKLVRGVRNMGERFRDFADNVRPMVQDTFPKIIAFFKDLTSGANGTEAGKAFADITASAETLAPIVQELTNSIPVLTDVLKIGATVMGFLADHVDTLADLMPVLALGYVGVKAGQLAANVASLASVPLKIAEIAVNRQLTKSNIALIASREAVTASIIEETTATQVSTLAKIKDKIASYAQIVAEKAKVVALKASTIATRALGIAMKFALGPIGIAITVIAALAAGLIYAYKHSATFRKIVDGAFKGVQVVVKATWERVLKPYFKFIINGFLAVASAIVHGAAKAFGWVPGVGPKLRNAAREFDKFKTNVNRALDGVHDEKVDITARFHNQLPKTLYGVRVGGGSSSRRGGITSTFRDGGGVHGPGTGTSDSIVARLSAGEHVWTAKEVSAAGGHNAVERMRKSVLAGFAAGGAVFRMKTSTPGGYNEVRDGLNRAMPRAANEIAVVSAKAINKALASPTYNPNLAGGLAFAKAQTGKPYIWGGVGPRGYDCSGFMSAILNVVQGKRPYSRRFSTGTFPAAGFVPGPGAFMIGSRRGNPGHMAGTINGVNVESSGSIGPHWGRGARGARDRMFSGVWHLRGYARGGRVGDAPFDLLDPRGRRYAGDDVRKAILGTPRVFDSGGWVPPGRSVIDNRTGGPEHLTRTDRPIRLHPADIRAVGEAMGQVVLAGIGANNVSISRSADRFIRGG